MPVESAADRLAFLDADAFGAEGVYTPAGGPASDPFPGIFDQPSTEIGLNGVGTTDARPTFLCRADDLPAAADADADDQIAIGGQGSFVVFAIEPDGQGMVLLRLGALT
jgi:hypothetical protein